MVEKLPRVVIIENVRGFTLKMNAALLARVKECLQALHYSIHIRIVCTSQSAVPRSRDRCYVVGIRGLKVGLKWPKVLTMVGLQYFLDRNIVKKKHMLNNRHNTLLCKLLEKRKGRLENDWYCIDVGCSLQWVSCLKGKCPCLTRSRACGHYLPRLRRFLTLAEHGALQVLPTNVTSHMRDFQKLGSASG